MDNSPSAVNGVPKDTYLPSLDQIIKNNNPMTKLIT